MQQFIKIIEKLKIYHHLDKEEWITLIENRSPELTEYLFAQAREVRHHHYGYDVYIRGLIEFSNYCKNDCLYCGIQRSNHNVSRYRLTEEEILNCCHYSQLHPKGRELGILAGANVVMPNLSPQTNRKSYSLYNNKIATDEEAAEGKDKLVRQMESIGYQVVTARGDSLML